MYSGVRPLSFDATNTISLSAVNKVRRSLRLNQMKLPIFHIGLRPLLTYKNDSFIYFDITIFDRMYWFSLHTTFISLIGTELDGSGRIFFQGLNPYRQFF